MSLVRIRQFDRRWMIVEESTLKACTGRQFPKVSLTLSVTRSYTGLAVEG